MNEFSARQVRDHGERIATLEERYGNLVNRLNHLDHCVDKVNVTVAKNAGIVQENIRTWDGRWKIGLGVILGMIVAAGSGTVSLKSLIELISKLHP